MVLIPLMTMRKERLWVGRKVLGRLPKGLNMVSLAGYNDL